MTQENSENVNNNEPSENGDKRNPDGTFGVGNKGGPGRPPGSVSLVSILRRKVEEIPMGQVKTYAEQIIEVALENAIVRKDQRAVKDIMEYIDGKPKQPLEIEADKESIDSLTNLLREVATKKNDNGPTETEA